MIARLRRLLSEKLTRKCRFCSTRLDRADRRANGTWDVCRECWPF